MLFHPNSEKNKHGYYSVGPVFRSYSLVECMEYKKTQFNNYDIRWHFNDEFFSTIDWTTEPQESLKDLYAARARQLREKYDYLVLCFSGGSDSHNILNIFAEYNIPLDEVLTHHSYDISKVEKTSSKDLMTEVWHAALPEFERIKHKLPGTVHRVVDASGIIRDTMHRIETTDLKYDFIYYNNVFLGPSCMNYGYVRQISPYQKLKESGKTVCFIDGADKPNIRHEHAKWFFNFASGWDIMTRFQIENLDEEHHEYFYWSPDAWKIIVKQCHMIRDYFTRNPNVIKTFPIAADYVDRQTPFDFSGLVLLGRAVPTSYIKRIIYPYWREDIVQCGKTNYVSPMLGITNQWYWDLYDNNSVETRHHIAGVKKHVDVLGVTKDLRKLSSLKRYTSQKYYF